MKILFNLNLEKENTKQCTEQAVSILEQAGAECFLEYGMASVFDDSYHYADKEATMADFDLIVAVGGDGTIMDVGKQAALYDKPVLGINSGRLGFMAGVETDDLTPLQQLVTGDYTEQPRMLLEIVLKAKHGVVQRYIAVNDLLITKAALSSLIDVDVLCGEKLVNEYRADSILFATPTGSTAYSLSNGGPIADPTLSYISMSPICPHSFASRTYLFHENTVLTVKLGDKNRNSAYLVIDGQVGAELGQNDIVEITASQRKMRLISLNNKEFYEVVSKKFVVS
ncbi:MULTISPECIES: NAD(+)/NADH kinase [Clostridiaceae]|uniref:NAD kinase n=1 Tax=Clostridium facile TaxID=2763035 RepID=A0ABR7IQ64_9CLOT|nr:MULTISPECIES: NAD(+)/NADH kinase [Clostridiaceae]MBC5787290.1 NAD(+)/NADH kinase [Clostridium facile]